jgi:biopolymer transport protein ExbD
MPRRPIKYDDKISLPITPMLDMTFQLLFFFIMNFNPADLEGQMDMSLPSEDIKAAKDKPADAKAAPEKTPEPEFPSDLTVQVRTQNAEGSEGGISAIFVRGLVGKEEPIKGIDSRELLANLKIYLHDKQATLTHKESIKIRGDSHLRIKHLMKVMDVCKAAGYTNTSLIPPEDQGR